MTEYSEIRVAVIEDNRGDFFLIEEYLIEEFDRPDVWQYETFRDAQNKLFESEPFDVILLDLSLPDAEGEELVNDILKLAGNVPVIVLTGYSDKDFGLKTLSLGVSDYLLKDELNAEQLKRSILYSTERKRVHNKLEESEKQYKHLFDLNPLPVWVQDQLTYKILDVNRAAIDHYGYTKKEFLEMSILDIEITDESKKQPLDNVTNQSADNFDKLMSKHKKSNGEIIDVEIRVSEIEFENRPALLVIAEDVTLRRNREENIRKSLKEKDILLAEIHHRVKNNLAVISAMLQLQAAQADNDELTTHLFDSIVRIKAIANIHEHLYQSKSFSELNFSENIKELVEKIAETFDRQIPVDIQYDCEDEISINVNQAIPCSLIANEVVTNSLKHAFDDKKKDAAIAIELKLKEEIVHLSIEDNGVGISNDVISNNGYQSSLGMQIITVLSQQLKADFSYNNNRNGRGTRFQLSFKKANVKGTGASHLHNSG